ncbi:MAG: DUF4129 domain-containing protein [Kovacikia sp.]
MTSASFETTNLSWQIQQLQQRLGEGIEKLFAPIGVAPVGAPPEWLIKTVFWAVSLVLIGWASRQLYSLLRAYFHPSVFTDLASDSSTQLPHPALTADQWLQRSRTFARQGNYREACRSLYLAALQRLNDKQLIAQESSRTDGEYRHLLQEISHAPPYQLLIDTHERLCFGNAEISAETFDQCQQAYGEIER